MLLKRLLIFIGTLYSFFPLFLQAQEHATPSPLEEILAVDDSVINHIITHVDKHQPQIIYTQIDRDTDNHPQFKTYTYHYDPDLYFYPASTVKMPTAFLALEKINQLKTENLTKYTCMLTDSAFSGQTSSYIDSTSDVLCPTVANYIRKIFLVSDNDAFNRLYEFLGPNQLNNALHKKGFTETRIIHRLSIPLPYEQNQYTNPIRFVDSDKHIIYQQSLVHNPKDFAYPNPIHLGKGEIIDDSLYQRPKDFAQKNGIPLMELHDMLTAVMFPDDVPDKHRFDLRKEDYDFLYQYMSQLPKESVDFPYSEDTTAYYDSYAKYVMFGHKRTPIPSHIRIFNKIGMAYGFLTDVAYVVDFQNNIEFILAVNVYVNENEVFNDGQYQYDEWGLPFLGKLGQYVYEYELKRERLIEPDLSSFQLIYGD